jgi:hypothetical protein
VAVAKDVPVPKRLALIWISSYATDKDLGVHEVTLGNEQGHHALTAFLVQILISHRDHEPTLWESPEDIIHVLEPVGDFFA